jgi:prepilin-type N-terminal cleavage/methylation domain-containing protein
MTVYTNKNLNIAPKANARRGFSLMEIITVMVISSMVMISTLTIFNRIKNATASINAKLDKEDIADEILQRIAEDLDRLAAPGFDTTVTIKSKISNGFSKTQLVIQNKIYDKNSKPQIFEKIVWQSEYDELEDMTILYRYHGGLCLEDKILDGQLKDLQADGTERFVPICWGMTLFEIVVPKEDAEPLTQWSKADLPTSVAVSISFAEPVEYFDGGLEIPEEDIITRHVAIDRTRKPRFVFEKKDFTRADPNDLDDSDDPNDVGATTKDDGKRDSKTKEI